MNFLYHVWLREIGKQLKLELLLVCHFLENGITSLTAVTKYFSICLQKNCWSANSAVWRFESVFQRLKCHKWNSPF